MGKFRRVGMWVIVAALFVPRLARYFPPEEQDSSTRAEYQTLNGPDRAHRIRLAGIVVGPQSAARATWTLLV